MTACAAGAMVEDPIRSREDGAKPLAVAWGDGDGPCMAV